MGKRITLQDELKPQDWLPIVGVVDEIRQQSLTGQPEPAIYQPLEQVTRPFFINHVSYVVRTALSPQSVAACLRGALYQVGKNQPVSIAPLTDLMTAMTADIWFQTSLISAFSILALFLAAIGIYRVLAYAVIERTREIGIRMAFGADKSDVTWMLLKRTLLLVGAGVSLGGSGAFVLTRVLGKFLFEVKPTDPATFLSVRRFCTYGDDCRLVARLARNTSGSCGGAEVGIGYKQSPRVFAGCSPEIRPQRMTSGQSAH